MGPPTKARPKRVSVGPFSSDRILNSGSPILQMDVHAFLIASISGWSTCSQDEKRSIIASLPPAYRLYNTNVAGELLCPITVDFVQQDPWVKAAVGKFKRDVEDGYYEHRWQTKARRAMAERREGKFDEYLREHAEELFGKGKEIVNEDGERQQSDSDWGQQRPGKSGKKGSGESSKDVLDAADVKRDGTSSADKVATTCSGRRSAKPASTGN